MILFDQVVKVFDVPQLTAYGKVPFCFELVKRFGVRRIFVHGDHSRLVSMRGSERCEKELLGSVRISRRAQEEIKHVADAESMDR